jgi:hypothetical protein
MFKKLTLLLAAVAVVAFAVPSLASASKATIPAGTLAPVGTAITTTGSDIVQKSSTLGALTCATLTLNGKITKNDGTTLEASGSNSNPAQSGCVNGTKSIIFTTFEITKLVSTTSGSGTMSYTAKEDIGTVECTFIGTSVPFTYTVGGSAIVFSEAGGITSSPAACGTMKLSGQFKLEKTGTSTALILD